MQDKEHFLKTIADLESAIDARDVEHERWKRKTRSMINDLCEHAGLEPKYDLSASDEVTAPSSSKSTVRPDEFYNKPLATAVKGALSVLRSAGRAPASLEAIYEMLIAGGFEFQTRSKEVAIQGLSVSIGKNSESFVKLSSGLIGLKEWYGQSAPKIRPRLVKNSEATAQAKAGSAQTEATSDSAPDNGGQQ